MGNGLVYVRTYSDNLEIFSSLVSCFYFPTFCFLKQGHFLFWLVHGINVGILLTFMISC